MSTQSADPLLGARLKIDRAKEHIHELEREIRAFLGTNPYVIKRFDDPQTGDQVYRVQVRAQVSPGWGAILGDIFHNLRSALDQLAEQVIIQGGGAPTKKTGFPVSDSRQEFETGGLRRMEGASTRALRIIKALKPYRGGCEPLWWLHQLNIEDKHHLVVPVGAAYRHFELTPRMRVPWRDEPVVGPSIAIRPADRLFPLEDGVTIFAVRAAAREPQFQDDYRFAFEIAFGKGRVLEGEPLFPTLFELAESIERVVRIFDRWMFDRPHRSQSGGRDSTMKWTRDTGGAGDYAELVDKVKGRLVNRSCPICGATAWRGIPDPVILEIVPEGKQSLPAATVPVACSECGYILLFLVAQLEQKGEGTSERRT